MVKSFDRMVRPRAFQEGELVLVLRRPIIPHRRMGGKFEPRPFCHREGVPGRSLSTHRPRRPTTYAPDQWEISQERLFLEKAS